MDVEIEITDHYELWMDSHPKFDEVADWLDEFIGPHRVLVNDQLPTNYTTGYSYRWIGTTGIDCYYLVFYRAQDALLFKMTWM